MERTIRVSINKEYVDISREVFEMLLAPAVGSTYKSYEQALENENITLDELVTLAKRSQIPYALFFAPSDLVAHQCSVRAHNLTAGISKETFSVNTRSSISIREIESILRDLIRKQEEIKKHEQKANKNSVARSLKKEKGAAEDIADRLRKLVGFDIEGFYSLRNKERALESLIEMVEASNILVSQGVQGYMPQRVRKVGLSGITVNDRSYPFIFLAGGSIDQSPDVAGRKIFTLALLLTLIARGIFSPVTYDGHLLTESIPIEYDIAGAFLMPVSVVEGLDCASLEAIKNSAEYLKVTPSASIVRLCRLSKLTPSDADRYLESLRLEFSKVVRSKMNRPRPVNGLTKYNGATFTRKILDAFDASKMSSQDFYRIVGQNKIGPSDLPELRRAVKA